MCMERWRTCSFSSIPYFVVKMHNQLVPDGRFEGFAVSSLLVFVGVGKNALLLFPVCCQMLYLEDIAV